MKLREKRLADKTRRLTSVLRWEPVLGIAVLVCVGLLNVFAGTLTPFAAAAQQQQPGAKPAPFTATVLTKDGKYTATLTVNPNRFGTNVFTVSVVDKSTGQPATNIGVTLYTTMLDMDMGTASVNLLPDGKGHFSTSGDLAMAGCDLVGHFVAHRSGHRLNAELVRVLLLEGDMVTEHRRSA